MDRWTDGLGFRSCVFYVRFSSSMWLQNSYAAGLFDSVKSPQSLTIPRVDLLRHCPLVQFQPFPMQRPLVSGDDTHHP